MELKRGPILFQAIFVLTLMACNTNFHEQPPSLSASRQARSTAWRAIGPGGGGALFNPTISPHDSNLVFVSCDMTGSFFTENGGASWQMFNLHGVVDFYVFDPIDSNTIYANSIALFRSGDRGKTWKVIYPAASEITGMVSKGDHASEAVVTKDSSERTVMALAVDPADSKKLDAVISINGSIGFYDSPDQGLHWNKEQDLKDKVLNIFIDPFSPKDNRSIYLTGTHSIYCRINGQWKLNSAPPGVQRLTQYTAGFDSAHRKSIIYAISGKSFYNPTADISGVFYTDDGGRTWKNREPAILLPGMPGAKTTEWRAISTSARHPESIYLSYNDLQLSADSSVFGVAKSNDFGISWKLCWKDLTVRGKESPAANVNGGWINDRFGAAWPGSPLSLTVSADHADVCYATDLGRIIKTVDGGDHWDQCYTTRENDKGWISRGIDVTTGYHLAFDPFDKNHVLIANTDIGLLESQDGGESWSSDTKDNGIPDRWTNTTYWVEFDPDIKGKAWAAMSGTHDLPRPKMWRRKPVSGFLGGIVMTTDGGKTWKPVSADIGEAAVTHILIDPATNKNARTLYACVFGKGVYKSVDGGNSWKQKNKGIEEKEPFAWRICKDEKNSRLFLIISRRSEDGSIGNDGDGSVYYSDDRADNWQKTKLPDGTNGPTSMLIDANTGNRILLSAWGRLMPGAYTPDSGGGIFITDDLGKTWKQVMPKDQHIHDLSFDARNKRYYACGFEGAAYFSENRGDTWNRIKGYDFKWGKRVEPDPSDPEKIYIITFGGSIWHGPVVSDDSSETKISMPGIR